MSTSSEDSVRGRGGRGAPSSARSGSGSPVAPAITRQIDPSLLSTVPTNISVTPGTAGTAVRLQTNFIEWALKKVVANGYHVTFTPEIESVAVRRRLLDGLKDAIGTTYLYDGDANLKTLDEVAQLTHVVPHPRTPGLNITINFLSTGAISMNSPEMYRLYNTQGRRNMRHLGYVQIGFNYFNPDSRQDIRGFPDLQLWFGMDTTVNIYADAPLMVLNSISKVVRRDTAKDFMRKIYTECQARGRDFRTEVRRQLVNRIVLTTYNNKYYRVADVTFDESPMSTFDRTDRDGNTNSISYKQYLQDQYHVQVTDNRQPLLLAKLTARDIRAGKTDQCRLVPEFCKLTGLGDLSLNTQIKREMIAATKKNPGQRVADIYAFMGKLTTNPVIKDEIGRWGISFARSLYEVTGRVLDAEKIYMADGRVFQAERGDLDRGMRNHHMPEAVALRKWSVVVPRRDEHIAKHFVQLVLDSANRLGMHMAQPSYALLSGDRIGDYMTSLTNLSPETQLIMPFIGRATETDKYSAIKRRLCVECPVASQVIVLANAGDEKKQRTMASKVAIQMNCKLGGVPWRLDIPPKDVMVIGFDTHHDTNLRRSCGGYVSSLDPSLTKWYSRVNYHESLQELSEHFRANVRASLEAYRKHNNKYPARVVLYRDGVSEGHIPHVFNIERNEIKKALEEASPVDAIRFAFIIVTKRVSARFFTYAARKGDQDNPSCGTVVDTGVTRKNRYDFYLIAQSVRQGTVSPVNYNIIEDTVGWPVNNHQKLAYKLCHMYFNWSATIKVPAPCQYAHKLAFLTGSYIHAEPAPQLCDRLFFL